VSETLEVALLSVVAAGVAEVETDGLAEGLGDWLAEDDGDGEALAASITAEP